MRKNFILVIIAIVSYIAHNQHYYYGKRSSVYAGTGSEYAISGNGLYVLVEDTSWNSNFYQWDGATYASISTITHSNTAYNPCLTQDGTFAVSAEWTPAKVLIYQLSGGTYSKIRQFSPASVSPLSKISRDSSIIAAYSGTSGSLILQIYSFDGATQTLIDTLNVVGTSKTYAALQLASDGSFIVLCNQNNNQVIIAYHDGASITTTQYISLISPLGISLSSDDKYLSINNHQKVELYENIGGTFQLVRSDNGFVVKNAVVFNDASGFVSQTSATGALWDVNYIQIYHYLNIQEVSLIETVGIEYRYSRKPRLSTDNTLLFVYYYSVRRIYVFYQCFANGCVECSAPMICGQCYEDFTLLSNGTCICDNLNYSISSYGKCVNCSIQNCQICSIVNTCKTCKALYFLQNNSCISSSQSASSANVDQYLLIGGLVCLILIIILLITVIIIQIYRILEGKAKMEQINPKQKSKDDISELHNNNINITTQNLNEQNLDVYQFRKKLSNNGKQLKQKDKIFQAHAFNDN